MIYKIPYLSVTAHTLFIQVIDPRSLNQENEDLYSSYNSCMNNSDLMWLMPYAWNY